MSTIMTAHREYARRTADERFASLADLLNAAVEDKQLSAERSYNLKDLRIVADADSVKVASARGLANLTHWSFGQLARTVGAPASFLRDDLSAQLTADVLNYRIGQSAPGTSVNVLVRAANGHPEPTVRALTSDKYGRVWDAELYGAMAAGLSERSIGNGHEWKLPTAWDGKPAGAYRGDRDAFVIMIDGGSIVDDPSAAQGNGAMYRGIMVRNSEVGAASVTIETVMFRFICGNLMLWGATLGSSFRRRHVGTGATRDAIREVLRVGAQWSQRSASADERIIRTLIDRQLAETKDGIVDELRALGYSQEDAIAAYDRCEREESVSPRSYWGIVQGTTRLSQDSQYASDRYELDKLAGLVLARGARLVAA